MGKITVYQVNKGKVERVQILPKCSLFNKYNKMVEEEEQQFHAQQVETSFINQKLILYIFFVFILIINKINDIFTKFSFIIVFINIKATSFLGTSCLKIVKDQ